MKNSSFFNCLNHDSLDSRICLISNCKLMSHVPANVALPPSLSRVPSNVILHLACAYSKNRTEQNRTEQNRTEQNRTEQNRTEQNRTEPVKVR